MTESVQSYYNRIGSEYDQDRFGNSYGAYIHRQEASFLNRWLPENPTGKVLDMGCGTGRFLSRATEGVDFSEGMLAQAAVRFPDKPLHTASITATGLESNAFDSVFSMHVLMHLDRDTIEGFLDEAYRLLKTGGTCVVDFPSAHRRSFGQRKSDHWHGSSAFRLGNLPGANPEKWELLAVRGILFFPVHRIPVRLRGFFIGLDNLFCRSFLKRYASYLVVVMRKR